MLIRELGGNAFPYLHYDELLHSEQIQSVDILADVPLSTGGALRMVGCPWHFSALQPDIRLAPPRLGEHTADILRELGVQLDRIKALRERHIIAMP